MKNILLFPIFILAFSISLIAQKEGEEAIFKKGEIYHIAVDNLLIPTTDVFASAEKYKGKIKVVLQFAKPQNRVFHISNKKTLLFKELEPIDFKNIGKHKQCCICNVSNNWIPYLITATCSGRKNCTDCCAFVDEALDGRHWLDIE